MSIQHSSRTDRWFTPEWIVRKVHNVLGPIDLDPASKPLANKFIEAKHIITEEEDGLVGPWAYMPATVYCNPPGGKIGNQSRTFLFWHKLMRLRERHMLKHAIFMCFSVEALQSTQGKDCRPIGDFYVCIPKKRIAFDFPTGTPSSSPSHSNAIVYVPGTTVRTIEFHKHFSDVGSILQPWSYRS